jgi:hypothetical protein
MTVSNAPRDFSSRSLVFTLERGAEPGGMMQVFPLLPARPKPSRLKAIHQRPCEVIGQVERCQVERCPVPN